MRQSAGWGHCGLGRRRRGVDGAWLLLGVVVVVGIGGIGVGVRKIGWREREMEKFDVGERTRKKAEGFSVVGVMVLIGCGERALCYYNYVYIYAIYGKGSMRCGSIIVYGAS